MTDPKTTYRTFYEVLEANNNGKTITPFEDATWKLAIQIGGGQNVHNVYPALVEFTKVIKNV